MKHAVRLFVTGVVLGAAMFLVGGLLPIAPAKCPRCAVIVHPTPTCHAPVQGGWTC